MNTNRDPSFYEKHQETIFKFSSVIIGAVLTFMINLLIGISNDITEIKIRQAEGTERGKQRAITVDELKTDTRAIRADLSVMKERIDILEVKESSKSKTQ